MRSGVSGPDAVSELDLSAAREVRRLDKLGLLSSSEILCEVEAAGVGTRPGALIVTDKRVIFLSTTLIRRRTRVISVRLHDVASAESSSEWLLGRESGVLVLTPTSRGPRADEPLRFDAIPGGQARADELARTILRQRDYLYHRSESERPNGVEDTRREEDFEGVTPRVRISVGRGVASYVNSHGGCLYVWGDPVGGFDWMKASTERPDGVDFVRVDEVADFELYVECDVMAERRLRLARRWWNPQRGILVDTGLVLGP